MDYKTILENKLVDQLRDIARKAAIKGFSNWNKDELIENILKHFEGDEKGLVKSPFLNDYYFIMNTQLHDKRFLLCTSKFDCMCSR
jgi:Rho termination factor, N-terminal domain